MKRIKEIFRGSGNRKPTQGEELVAASKKVADAILEIGQKIEKMAPRNRYRY